MLETRSLSFAYDEQSDFLFPDIQLADKGNLLVLGESGIGKTTLLHLIAGILKPKSGSIALNGTKLNELSAAKLDRFRGQHIGLVFQQPHFIQALTLKENLELVQYFANVKHNIKRIKEVVDNLGIATKLDKKPHLLSKGEQQRAAIALAVINSPQLILADEPTANLDDTNCAKVVNLLKEQAETMGSQLMIITHDKRLKDQFQNTFSL